MPVADRIIQLNLIAAWSGILAGFISGLLLGLFFHREDWLGGYGSFKRRLYRLAHISLFGLAIVNLMFYFTVQSFVAAGRGLVIASWAFIIGAITMPICCLVTAHFPPSRPLFTVPVLSLLLGATLTLLAVARPNLPAANAQRPQTRPPHIAHLLRNSHTFR